jgi:TatD DNase family protein
MLLIDTHTHIYLEEFNNDRDESIRKAIDRGIKYLLLPNIDTDSVENMLAVCKKHPGVCFPMIGLHPTSVTTYYEQSLEILKTFFRHQQFLAIGETGIDLYWDKTLLAEQEKAFIIQLYWAVKYDLPIVIHSRNSLNEIFKILREFKGNTPKAKEAIEMGFKIGIGGVVTYKNSGMAKVVEAIDLKHILLETDAPFLPPVPYRGQRNESAYIYEIAVFVAQIKNLPIEEVAEITSKNAAELFKIPK